MSDGPRYDGIAEWYRDFRPSLTSDELAAIQRLLGPGRGRCLDLGCGTGVATAAVGELGWSAVRVDASEDLVEIARARRLEAIVAPGSALPFDDATLDAAVSVWTHTDIDDFLGGGDRACTGATAWCTVPVRRRPSVLRRAAFALRQRRRRAGVPSWIPTHAALRRIGRRSGESGRPSRTRGRRAPHARRLRQCVHGRAIANRAHRGAERPGLPARRRLRARR
jgi:SAM-dependent methyltransferase